MDQQTWALLIALAVAVTSAVLTHTLGRRRNYVEMASKVADLWREWSDDQGEQIRELRADLDEEKRDLDQVKRDLTAALDANEKLREENLRLRRALRSLLQWAKGLEAELIRVGGNKPPFPDDVVEAIAAEIP